MVSSSTRRIIFTSLDLIQKDHENPGSFPWHRLPLSRILQYLYIITFSIRCLILAYTLKYPDLYESYIAIDPSMVWVAHFACMQPLIAIACSASSLLILYSDYLFFVQKCHKFWFYVHELLIVNGERFWKLNKFVEPFDWRHPWMSLLERKNWFVRTWNGENRVRFLQANLKMYPYFDQRERTRAVLVTSFWENIDWLFSSILGKSSLLWGHAKMTSTRGVWGRSCQSGLPRVASLP